MVPYVLIVDNNPMNVEFIRYLLSAKGYEVRTALLVDEGIKLMRESAPCLIISDLNMRLRGGFDFLRKVKRVATWREIPFVLISATSWLPSDVEMAQQLGADKYVFRPIEPQALLDELEPYLAACRPGGRA